MRIALVLFFVLMIVPSSADAALIAPSSEVVAIHLSPAFPGSGERVTATVNSTGNTGAFSYTWTVNGVVVAAGPDERTVNFVAGEVGSQTNISVVLVGQNGDIRGSAARAVRPANVDIVWEGKTYVPPFYGGRPLVGGSSAVVLAAIPRIIENGERTPSGALSYSWSVNGQKIPGQSGSGKSSIEIFTPFFDTSFTVSVVAETRSGATLAESSAFITPVSPIIVVYEDLPLSGVNFNRALLNDADFPENEIRFRAYPFFVADPDGVTYAWDINGVAVTDSANPRNLMVRKEESGGSSGTYIVTASFKNALKLFEKGVASFTLSI